MSTIGKGDNADVVSRGGDAVLSAAGAGLVRNHGPTGQFSFEPLRARNGFGHQLQQESLALGREDTLGKMRGMDAARRGAERSTRGACAPQRLQGREECER